MIDLITSVRGHMDIIPATNMLSFYTILTVLVVHWIFDFFLQTDEMAKGKSSSNMWLGIHAGVYSLGLLLITILNFNLFASPGLVFSFWILNVIAHFFTDYVTSRASSLLWKDSKIHDFFVVIGCDQLLHYITIFGTLIWLTQ